MKIQLLMMGKNKGDSVEKGIADFAQKLKAFCTLELTYVKDESVHDDLKKLLQKEQERLQEKIPHGALTIVLDEKGKSFDSIEFSKGLKKWHEQGHSSLVFVIGSAHGLSEGMKQLADVRLSLSPLTMSHQLVRLVLLEQIYRAFTLIRGMKYHK